jgi:hypothetical protein
VGGAQLAAEPLHLDYTGPGAILAAAHRLARGEEPTLVVAVLSDVIDLDAAFVE